MIHSIYLYNVKTKNGGNEYENNRYGKIQAKSTGNEI